MTENVRRRKANSKDRHYARRPLLSLKKDRQYAKSLYDTMMQATNWECPCRDQHSVCIRLTTNDGTAAIIDDTEKQFQKFRLMVGSEAVRSVLRYLRNCTEIEVKSFKRDTFPALSASNISPHSSLTHRISNICTALKGYEGRISDSVGCLVDEGEPIYQHKVFLVGNLNRSAVLHSLNDLLSSSMDTPARQYHSGQSLLSRRERLNLAVNLACSVLKYHGSWLKSDWGTKDILINRQQDNKSISPQCAWLLLPLSEHLQSPNSSPKSLWNNNYQNDSHVLFPLGLELIKLSLGCKLSKQEASDSSDGDDLSSLGTAHRYIRFIYDESGRRYADVVKRCLFWTDSTNADLDDEDFQEIMFVSIIQLSCLYWMI